MTISDNQAISEATTRLPPLDVVRAAVEAAQSVLVARGYGDCVIGELAFLSSAAVAKGNTAFSRALRACCASWDCTVTNGGTCTCRQWVECAGDQVRNTASRGTISTRSAELVALHAESEAAGVPAQLSPNELVCDSLKVISVTSDYILVQAERSVCFRWVFAVPSTDHPGSWKVTSVSQQTLEPGQRADAHARGNIGERVSLYCGC